MAQVLREGFATRFIEREYGAFGAGKPLLNTFYFRYDASGSGVEDNHLNMLLLLPGGEAEDLTPDAENQPTKVPDGRVQLSLQDRANDSASDRYFYKVGHSVLSGVGGRRFQLRDVGAVGGVRRELPDEILPPGSHPVLTGFKMFYTGGSDHHVDEIRVEFVDGGTALHVSLNDRNNDDVFGYLVDFVVLRDTSLTPITTGVSSGSAQGGERVQLPAPPSRAEWGITGFRFDYPESGDTHLREVGAVREGRNLTVFYGDDAGERTFDWRIRWVYAQPPLVAPASS